MKCPHCGESVEISAKFCIHCGEKLSDKLSKDPVSGEKIKASWFRQANDNELSAAGDAEKEADSTLSNYAVPLKAEKLEEERSRIEEENTKKASTERILERINSFRGKKPDVFNKLSSLKGFQKKYVAILAAVITCGIILIAIFSNRPVNSPCDWCHRIPSVEFKTSDGSKAYVCKECMKRCMICSNKRATHHYENYFGMIVFVCDDCYREVKSN